MKRHGACMREEDSLVLHGHDKLNASRTHVPSLHRPLPSIIHLRRHRCFAAALVLQELLHILH